MLVGGADDKAYIAQAWGRERSDGRWEAWLVFAPISEGLARRTDRETTQSTREATEYWAAGVTSIYLEGAFARSMPLKLGSSAA